MACWKLIVSMCWHAIEFNVVIMGSYTANGCCFNYMYMYSVYLCLHAVCPGLSSQGRATYVHGCVVVINSDLLPTFSIINDIVVDSFNSHYFVLEILHTICFSSLIMHMKFP